MGPIVSGGRQRPLFRLSVALAVVLLLSACRPGAPEQAEHSEAPVPAGLAAGIDMARRGQSRAAVTNLTRALRVVPETASNRTAAILALVEALLAPHESLDDERATWMADSLLGILQTQDQGLVGGPAGRPDPVSTTDSKAVAAGDAGQGRESDTETETRVCRLQAMLNQARNPDISLYQSALDRCALRSQPGTAARAHILASRCFEEYRGRKFDEAAGTCEASHRLVKVVEPEPDAWIGVLYRTRGNLLMAEGAYSSALTEYEESINWLSRVGQFHPSAALTHTNAGTLLRRMGRAVPSIRRFERALDIRERHGGSFPLNNIATLNGLANALIVTEDLSRAMETLRLSLQTAGEIMSNSPSQDAREEAATRSLTPIENIGAVFQRLGQPDSAVAYYLTALKGWLTMGDSSEVSGTYQNLGYVHLDRSDPIASIRAFTDAVRWQPPRENNGEKASVLAGLAMARARNGQLGLAQSHIRDARALVANGIRPGRRIRYLLNYTEARIHHMSGRQSEAIVSVDAALSATSEETIDPESLRTEDAQKILLQRPALDALRLRANALTDRGSPADHLAALATIESAVRLLEAIRANLTDTQSALLLSERNHAVFSEGVSLSLDLAASTGDQRFAERAFQLAERARAGVLQDAIVKAGGLAALPIPDSLRQALLDLRQGITATRTALASSDSEAPRSDLRTDLFELERRHDRLLRELGGRYPAMGMSALREWVSSEQVRSKLAPDQAILTYSDSDTVFHVFVLTAGGFSTLTLAGDDQTPDVSSFVETIRNTEAGRFRAMAWDIYRELVRPARALLPERITQVRIVPDGDLAFLPFEALLTEPVAEARFHHLPFLGKEITLSYGYAASIEGEGGQASQATAYKNSLVAFAPDPSLEGAYAETARIVELFDGTSFRGPQATEAAAKQLTTDATRILHFATHSVADEEAGGSSYLRLNPADGEDGRLSASEIYGIRVNPELVVLSACETARGQRFRGEGTVGVTRSFIQAGARSVLATLWPISDESTSRFMQVFYRELSRGREAVEAVRIAKNELISSRTDAEPFVWAPFVLVTR